MAQIHGSSGVIRTLSGEVAEVKSFSFDETAATYQTTEPVMGTASPALTFSAGAKSWTGSVECVLDASDTIQAALTIGSTAVVSGFPESGSVYSGTCRITGRSVSASVDGMVTLSLSLQGTGTLIAGDAIVSLLSYGTYTSDQTGTGIDLTGYSGAYIYVDVGTTDDTINTTNKIVIKSQNSNDDGDTDPYADVATIATIDTAGELDARYTSTYSGSDYLRLLVDFSGTHTNGTPVGAFAILY